MVLWIQISHCPECHSQLMIVQGFGHGFGEYHCPKCDEYTDYIRMRERVEDKLRLLRYRRAENRAKRRL